ncbi:MAG: ABC transporter permease [Acidobacteriota bacterium]|nr:ABC transporter permease [Acidobacteriota bacterium]
MRRLSILAAMVVKDLRRHRRAPLAILLMLSFPLVFAGLLALSFGGGGEPSVPRVHLLIEDRDGGLAGNLVRSAFTAEQAAEYFDIEAVGEEGLQRMEAGEASALLRLPENFTEDLLEGRTVTLELIRNPAQSILPEIAEQITTVLAEGLSSASYLLDQPLSRVTTFLRGDGENPSDQQVSEIAVAVNQVVTRAGPVLFPPLITLETASLEDLQAEEADPGSLSAPSPEEEAEESSGEEPISQTTTIFLFILPGIAVFALFTLGDHVMRDLLLESERGTLGRQLVAPLGTGTVVAGKALSTAAVSCLSLMLLSLAAWWIGGRGVSLPAFALLAGSLVLAITGTAATLYGLARTPKQGATISSVVYLVMAFASGSFLPLNALPASVQAVAPVTPFYWATQGFQALLLERADVVGVWTNIAVLSVLGAVLLATGSTLLGRRLRQGALA